MKRRKGKIIFALIGIMVIVVIIVLVVKGINKEPKEQDEANTQNTTNTANEEKYVTQLDDGTKLNNSTNLISKKTYKTIEVSNAQFTSKNESSVFLADLKNVGNADFVGEEVILVLLDENDNTIKEIPTAIQSMKAGETKKWNIILTADVVNAKDIKIEEKK